MTVVVAGCGDLGTEVGLRLADCGLGVLGIRRSADRLPDVIEPLAADLTEPLPDLPADTELVVVAIAADERSEAAYRAAYVDGLRNLLDALDRSGARPRRTVLVSSTAVYGADDGSWVNETTPAEPRTATGAVLLDAEALLRGRVPGGVVFRAGGIYGPGRTYLIDALREGRATIPERPTHTNRIHRDDAAAAIIYLLTEVAEPAPVYLGVDHEPADRGEVLRFLAAELGLPPPPVGPARRARGGDKRCANTLLLGTGFRFAYPTYREGYRAVLAGEGAFHR